MYLIKNENLKQWINENYPIVSKKNINDVFFSRNDMEEFATWLQNKIINEIENNFNSEIEEEHF